MAMNFKFAALSFKIIIKIFYKSHRVFRALEIPV